MGLLERISENLQLVETEKQSLRKSILSLLFEWRGFEQHWGLTQKGFQECVAELESRERQLKLMQESVSESVQNLELLGKSVEERLKGVGDKEIEVISFYERGVMELELKEENLVKIQEKYAAELARREQKLNEHEKEIKGLLAEFESEKLQVVGIKNVVEKMFKDIGLKEKCFEDRRKEIELLQVSIERRARELDCKEREIEERGKEVEFGKRMKCIREELEREVQLKQKELDFMIEDLELKEKELDFIREFNEKLMKQLHMEQKQLESDKKFTEERFKELDLKKKEFLMKEDMLKKESKDLESRKEELDTREKKLEFEKKCTQECFKELDLKNKECQVKEDVLEKESKDLLSKKKELDAREKKLESEKKFTEEGSKELDLKKKECQVKEDMLEKESKDFELKKNGLDMREKQLESEKKFSEKRSKELDLKKKECKTKEDMLEKESKDLELKKNELDTREKQLDSEKKFSVEHSKELDLKKKECQVKEDMLEKESKDLESKKNELDARDKQLESEKKFTQECFKELELKERECQVKKDMLEKESKDLESKRKELEDMIKKIESREMVLELKEKQLNNVMCSHPKSEKKVDEGYISNSSLLGLKVVQMDGKSLQMFLNEREKDLDSLGDEVFEALQLQEDPPKLVLRAMEGFYPPHLRQGNIEFKGFVVRKSCILLLEQLMRMSPKIQSCVRDEALKLARKWKTKISVGNSLEVLGFLYLLACYNLASAFDTGEIVRFLHTVAHHQETPKFCRFLGLQSEIPSFIQNLLNSKQSLEAIRYIYAFELVDRFPPVPILKNYLKHAKKSAQKLSKKICNTWEAWNEAIDKRVVAMRAVIRCIVENKLESQYPPRGLEEGIKGLLMQKTDNRCTRSAHWNKAQGQQQVKVKQISSTSTVEPSPKAFKCASDSSNSFIAHRSPLAVILANMSGKNLLSFLSLHSDEHELLYNEVFAALRNCDDPAKLVLEAIEGFYHSHSTEEEASSCVLLFEQLMRLSPEVTSGVKEEANRIAFHWQANIRAQLQSPLLTLRFLLLIIAYDLASAFDRNELLNLYQTVAKDKHAPGFCEALGISKMIAGSAVNLSEVKGQQVRSENMLVNDFIPSSSVVPVFDFQSLRNIVDLEEEECEPICSEVPTFIYSSSDPAQLVLDALQICHISISDKSPQSVVKSFFHLLEQLMNVSPQIKPHVKEHALRFAFDWKEKLKGPHLWEALVFLQLVATYQLSSSFETDELLSLLEVGCYCKKASHLFRILGLVEKVPGFIWRLIEKRQMLLAFAYVYEFKLVDEFPPVALLKKHLLHSEVVAKKIRNGKQKTHHAEDKAIAGEICALKAVIKRIMDHNLQDEYSPDELRARIERLERQRENLKKSIPTPVLKEPKKLDANKKVLLAQKTQLQEDKKKRPAQDVATIYAVQQHRPRKSCRLGSPGEFTPSPQCATHPIHWMQPFSQHPGGLYEQLPCTSRAPVGHYSLGGGTSIVPNINQLAWH